MVTTDRLTLIPGNVALARAELTDRAEFGRLLAAVVPDGWPPETAADALPLFLSWIEASPERVGWFGWYALTRGENPTQRKLVAGGGFLGPPQDGVVRMGYSVLPEFKGQGYATEMVNGLIRWAFTQPGLDRIEAETEWANPASVRVLDKSGFKPVGPAGDLGGMKFELGSEKVKR
jgi:[ribosomal protein S5]-alanine N-acetyltransferase